MADTPAFKAEPVPASEAPMPEAEWAMCVHCSSVIYRWTKQQAWAHRLSNKAECGSLSVRVSDIDLRAKRAFGES